MSFTYQLQKINQSFDQIAACQEFMRRTELCFRKLHERILLLEQRPPIQAPTDEQLERVLRNILAERFSDPVMHHMKKDDVARDEGWFVKDPYPKSIKMNVASLLVPPESVPSQTYTDTFRMLEDGLDGFPGEDLLSEENEDRVYQSSRSHSSLLEAASLPPPLFDPYRRFNPIRTRLRSPTRDHVLRCLFTTDNEQRCQHDATKVKPPFQTISNAHAKQLRSYQLIQHFCDI
ncbi:hypothetical protein KJE20_10334 [Pyrenophora tritici-repentis]|nr:hypothetical protein KJE20_10334 [Pyrenophora tritici-repentis]